MTRYLCCLAVLAVGAVPDWATAYHPCWVPPPCGPVPAYPQQFYLVPPSAPVYEVPLPPPTVHVVPPAAATRPPAPTARPTPVPAPPAAEPVRPATNTTPPAPLPPAVVPTPKVAEPAPKLPDPPALKLPDPPAPKAATPDIPPLILPDPPAATEPPAKKADPKGPSLVLPAIPTPAPAPEPEPKRATDSIPPLVLPPDLPSGANGVVPPTTAKSSPLAAAPRVQVFPAAGAAAAGALRRVGFFNHTDRPVPLTIEGRAVTLPPKSYLHAQLPPTFRWSEAGGPPRTTTVPADSAGVDVLFGADSE